MLQDINQHIALIENSIAWAKEYGKDSFPYDVFKENRRKLKTIKAALEENCSAAAYGESQVGKSYLMSSLLSSPNSPFVITNAGKSYSFIDQINPSGGNNTKVESTGVVTRFALSNGNNPMRDYVKVRNLSVVDIILLIVDSYYNDIKIDQDSVLTSDQINKALDGMSGLWASKVVQQNWIDEDEVHDIIDYIFDVIGSPAVNIWHKNCNFRKVVATNIQFVSYDRWVDIFGLLWNKNSELNRLFCTLINEYKKINFQTDIYLPFDAVLRDKGTLLKIDWLDTVCGVKIDTGNDLIYTDIYDKNQNVIAHDFHKGHLSALIAELTFELPSSVAEDRDFLHYLDLLDFPGARSREKYKEKEIGTVLPQILRRGKVAYLFNKYSRSLRISSVLFCHHNDQKTEPTIGETINEWIEGNVGKTTSERAEYLNDTKGISPLFFIATKFNIDLERTKNDYVANKENLQKHWDRFDTVIPEIIKPNRWLNEWVIPGGIFRSSAFQSIFPLRDFYWSSKNRLFDGYSDGETKSEEIRVHVDEDYPDYFEDLKNSFLQNEFVKKHFADPEQSWNDVATINNDGSKAIIRNLDSIAQFLDNARRQKYLSKLIEIKKDMYNALLVYFEPEDKEAKNQKVKKIASDIRTSLILNVGAKPEIFGKIIDALMVPVGDLRDIAYDIIICHTDTPKDFSIINFIRKQADIDPNDNRQGNIQKLCEFFGCDEEQLDNSLKEQGCSIAEVVSSTTETLTTVADVVTKHIIDYWNAFINNRVKLLEPILPHAAEVVFMLSALLKKMGVRRILSERIDKYSRLFNVNEQPNAIADYASLTLNNFVSSVGRNFISDEDTAGIKEKAEKCRIKVDLSSSAWNVVRKPQPLLQTLSAFDAASKIDDVDRSSLMKLPLWDNFQRWENLVTIGLLYASDISSVDPIANAKIKEIIDGCNSLYNNR